MSLGSYLPINCFFYTKNHVIYGYMKAENNVL